ncbi:MAG TPA: lipase secretion chaperone [Steroidobacteraceae bacterium]|nr:lipase secretion chaperone [Steroidobacteraceae bacterium]
MKRLYIWLGIFALALIAGLVAFGPGQRRDEAEPAAQVAGGNEPTVAVVPSKDEEQQEPVPARAADAASPKAEPEATVAQTNDKTFRVNASGRLVLDEQTRLNMEALFARSERAQLAEAKQQAIEPLPAAASAQAAELLEHYDNYQQAQRQAYPPGVAPSTEEAALAELDGLHALRVAHFGQIVARALYGEEEAVSRKLVELMRLEKDQSLTMEEKAVRAQQLRDSKP